MTFSDYLDEIQKCIDNKLYIASLMMALTLPDICGSIQYPNESTTSRYKKWYQENVGQYFEKEKEYLQSKGKTPWPSADLVYSLRNNLLHACLPNLNKNAIHQEENKIDKFRLDFSDSCNLMSSKTDVNFMQERTVSYKINAKYLSQIMVNCAKSFYEENKDLFDSKYEAIKDNFGGGYLWTN